MPGGLRPCRQFVDAAEPARPRRRQRGGRRRPAGRDVVGVRRRQHLVGEAQCPQRRAGVHREGGGEPIQSGARARCRDPVANGLQESDSLGRLAEHPELVGGPRQRPRHQVGLRKPVGVDRGEDLGGLPPAALPGKGLGQGQPGSQRLRLLERGSCELLTRLHVTEPQRLCGGFGSMLFARALIDAGIVGHSPHPMGLVWRVCRILLSRGLNGRSACTARRARGTPNCSRWQPKWAKRSPTAAGLWCPAAATSRRWVHWPQAPAHTADARSG